MTSYAIHGTAHEHIFLAIHEITHNLVFRGVEATKSFAMFANLPFGSPYAITFKKCYVEHRKHLGKDGADTKPTPRPGTTRLPQRALRLSTHPLDLTLRARCTRTRVLRHNSRHPSWPMLTYRFIFDEDVGLQSRVKRHPKELNAVKKVEKEGEGERGCASDDECQKQKWS